MFKKLIWYLLFITSIMYLTSCGKSDYNNFESQFMKQYYAIIQNVDDKEVDNILKKLQSKENAKVLDNMSQLLNDNEDLLKSHKKEYISLQELYTGLIDLKNAYSIWDSLDLDRKLYLNSKLGDIYFYLSQKDYYLNKKYDVS